MLELLPKSIKGKDDVIFIMKYLSLSNKDLDIIIHAFVEAEQLISAHNDLKKSASKIFKRLASENSLLSSDAKILARIISNGKHANRARFLFTQIYKSRQKENQINNQNTENDPESKHARIIREEKEQYYFWKLQTNQNFREWSKSILQRAQPGARLILDKFISDENLKLVFACDKPYPMRTTIYFPFNKDKTARKHLLMQEVYSNPKLRAIIDAESFRIFILF